MNLNEGLTNSHSCRIDKTDVEIHFRDLQSVLLKEISQADVVLGCVAWITDPAILEALGQRSTVLIVDGKTPRMSEKLKSLYKKLQDNSKEYIYHFLKQGKGWEKYFCYTDKDNNPNKDQIYEDWNFESGIYAVDGYYQYMHHKFLITARAYKRCSICQRTLYKTSVWTGSYNFTKNAQKGLENALILRDPHASASYLCEFLEIFHNHSRQQNITGLEEANKGWKDFGGGYAPLCKRGLPFPLDWFGDCCAGIVTPKKVYQHQG